MLQASRGFTQLAPSLGVLVGYGSAILLFSRALEHGLGLGIAYGILTGCGLVAATTLSAVLFAEPLALAQACGLALVLLGAVVLQLRPGVLRRGHRG